MLSIITGPTDASQKLNWQAVWPIITPFLSDKQTRQESRFTSVDLNLKNGCIDVYPRLKLDIFWCSFCAITSKVEEMIGSRATWTEALQRSVKEPQNGIYCLNFLPNFKIWKLTLCFIPKVTCSVLSVGELSVSSLLRNVFFTVWEHESTMACQT